MRWSSNSLLLVCLAACHAVAPPRTDPREGVVGVEVIPDPNAPRPQLSNDQQFVRPAPAADNALPSYPAELLPLGLEPQVVAVRFVVDEMGSVAEILPSPVALSSTGPHASVFEASVEQALRSWRFSPGSVVRLTSGSDIDGDGKPDYKILAERTVMKVFYDLRFTFEVRDGKGVVTSSGTSSPPAASRRAGRR